MLYIRDYSRLTPGAIRRSTMRHREDCIRDTLEDNLGRMVIIFTDSGGASGEGFTGLLTDVGDDACRLVTSLPETPPNPVKCHRHHHNGFHDGCHNGFHDGCHNGCHNGCRRGHRRHCGGHCHEEFHGECLGDFRHGFHKGGEVTIPIDHICAVCATDHFHR